MRKTFGNPEEFEFAFFVARLEIEGCPATEVRRVAAEIDSDVPDVAGEDADEFALRMTELIVEAAEDSAGGERLIVLREGRRKAERVEGVGIKDLCEPATRITKASGLQNLYIAQGGIP